ncbi:hypothetical protein KEM48_009229 [Puccinia striiformis f. sp. tritici PST-130]|nr:hypothetical protein KEM48_009229 [Puccinia striiformis f. sp. tritici PST-130]
MSPLQALNLFQRITPAYIHIPPVCIRLSVAQEAAMYVFLCKSLVKANQYSINDCVKIQTLLRDKDDLTVKLTETIFTNTLIKTGLVKGVPTQNI